MGSQQRIVVMIAMIGKGSRSRFAITMISSGEIGIRTHGPTTTKSLTLQACFVLGFLLQTSLAYRLDPNPQTNSIFATVPSSSSSTSTTSSTSQLSSKHGVKVFYQSGNSEASLPVCSPNSVCNKVDTYGSPWVERQCRCPKTSSSGKSTTCSTSIHSKDGYTVVDRNRQYKMCEPVKKLKRCKYFRDVTWTYVTYPDRQNSTQQLMHC